MNKVTYKKLEPLQKLAVINARLRHGDMSKIAKKVGSNPTSVRNVIDGLREDAKILNAAYDMCSRRKKNFQVIKEMQVAYKKNQKKVNQKVTAK
tara:strand:- start:414 stop:695 length:282 start_codon:yes stop_codon:yes gene_type:complete